MWHSLCLNRAGRTKHLMYERAHTEGQMDTMAARALRAVSEALGQKGKTSQEPWGWNSVWEEGQDLTRWSGRHSFIYSPCINFFNNYLVNAFWVSATPSSGCSGDTASEVRMFGNKRRPWLIGLEDWGEERCVTRQDREVTKQPEFLTPFSTTA